MDFRAFTLPEVNNVPPMPRCKPCLEEDNMGARVPVYVPYIPLSATSKIMPNKEADQWGCVYCDSVNPITVYKCHNCDAARIRGTKEDLKPFEDREIKE